MFDITLGLHVWDYRTSQGVLRRCWFPWAWQDSSSALCKPTAVGQEQESMGIHCSPWAHPGDWDGTVPYRMYYGVHTLWGTWSLQSPEWGWTNAVLLRGWLMQSSGSSCSGLCSVLPISIAPSTHVFMWRVPECIIVVNPWDVPITACRGQTWRPGCTGCQSSSAHSSWTWLFIPQSLLGLAETIATDLVSEILFFLILFLLRTIRNNETKKKKETKKKIKMPEIVFDSTTFRRPLLIV